MAGWPHNQGSRRSAAKIEKGLGTERARLGTLVTSQQCWTEVATAKIERALATERARLATFSGFCTERARLGTFRGFGTERERLGNFNQNLSFQTFPKKSQKNVIFFSKRAPSRKKT